MKEFLLLSVLLTFVNFQQFQSFSIQKRQVKSHSDLKNAIKVLQRKRRRIDENTLRERLYEELPYLPYDDEYIPYGEDFGRENPNDLSDQYVLSNMLNAYQSQYADENKEDTKGRSKDVETPSLDELKQMFKQIDEKDTKDESTNKVQPDKSNDKISQTQMDQLLSEAVKSPTNEQKTVNDGSPKSDSQEPVSADELKDVFKESKTEGDKDQTENVKNKMKSLSEEFVNSNQDNSVSNKKKRMTKRDNSDQNAPSVNADETLLNLVEENQQLRQELYRLKLVEYLEDKENDKLAAALRDATLAQLGNAESYLEDEYKEIQRALNIEQALQDIKDSSEMSDNEDENEDEGEDIEPVEVKRNEPAYKDNLGLWYDQPIVDQDNDAQQKLEDFVKQYRQTYGLDNNDPGADVLPIEIPVPQTNEEVCPQLDLLSSNCEVAALLDIDNEARELCNRHEVCYVCGATVGISQHTCDAGFRSETVERCESSHCIQSGAEFLWFIKQDHKFTGSYIDQCDSPCVKSYIVGGS